MVFGALQPYHLGPWTLREHFLSPAYFPEYVVALSFLLILVAFLVSSHVFVSFSWAVQDVYRTSGFAKPRIYNKQSRFLDNGSGFRALWSRFYRV